MYVAQVLYCFQMPMQITSFKSIQNPNKKIQPLTKIDRTIQNEIQKHPNNTAFIIDARTGKILSTVPLKNFNTKKSPKIIPQKTPPKNNKILPYKMKEERLELL